MSKNLLATNLNSCGILFVSLCLRVIPLQDALESISSDVVVLVIGVTLLQALTILKLCDTRKVIYDYCQETATNSYD